MKFDRVELIKRLAGKLKQPRKVCKDCGYTAKGIGLHMLEDFISHRLSCDPSMVDTWGAETGYAPWKNWKVENIG